MSEKVTKVFRAEIKSVNKEKFTVDAVVSDESIDRHREKILADAWKKGLAKYKQHPVLLSSHNYYDLTSQIGMAEKVYVEDNKLHTTFKYFVGEGNAQADWGFKLAEKGIAAFSVGFIPKDWEDTWEESNGACRRVYKDVELLEVSQVLIPSNANALMKSIAEAEDTIVKSVATDIITNFYKELTHGEEEQAKEAEAISTAAGTAEGTKKAQKEVEIKTTVPYKEFPLMSEDADWNGAAARKHMQEMCGGKENMDWGKYAKGFTWVDSENSETLGAYKLPHHDVVDGKMMTNWKGVAAAMGALLGARGGTSIPDKDRKAVYNHLKKHYIDFDKEVPEFKSYNTIEDTEDIKDIDTKNFMIEYIEGGEVKNITVNIYTIDTAKFADLLKDHEDLIKGIVKEVVTTETKSEEVSEEAATKSAEETVNYLDDVFAAIKNLDTELGKFSVRS